MRRQVPSLGVRLLRALEEVGKPNAAATRLEVLGKRPHGVDEVHLDDRDLSDDQCGGDAHEATSEGAPMLLQYPRHLVAQVFSHEEAHQPARVDDETDDHVAEVQPDMAFEAPERAPEPGEDERKPQQAERGVERLSGQAIARRDHGDLEDDVAEGCYDVEQVLHQVEEQDEHDAEGQRAAAAELARRPRHGRRHLCDAPRARRASPAVRPGRGLRWFEPT
mmetsp:Transcript_33195/g.94389  ORF Transcript_33195/g.94389 Transcript_33195/m.94389 type:complete len:221 (+) Transcript_33195:237-899(+)